MPDTREAMRVSELNLITFLPHSPAFIHLWSAKGTQQHTQQKHHSLFARCIEDIKWDWTSRNILTTLNAPIPSTCSEISSTRKWRRGFWLYSTINVQILFLQVIGQSILTCLHILPLKEPANHNLIPR